MKRLIMITTSAYLMMAAANVMALTGDPVAGQQKAQVCGACHGADGNSMMAQNPVLAGQSPGYIAKELARFKSGARVNPIMAGMTQPLSEQDMRDLDAWYSSQDAEAREVSSEDLDLARAGEQIYRGGYAPLSIPACMACHGPAGYGIPPNYPRLSAQWPEYLENQLLAFKSGQRASEVMGPIAFLLSAQQIKVLSLYMSALH
jgi:cytochrome c553